MTTEQYRRMAWFWFAFPGRAKTAFRYEQFLQGMLQQFPLHASEYNVRIKPVSLLDR